MHNTEDGLLNEFVFNDILSAFMKVNKLQLKELMHASGDDILDLDNTPELLYRDMLLLLNHGVHLQGGSLFEHLATYLEKVYFEPKPEPIASMIEHISEYQIYVSPEPTDTILSTIDHETLIRELIGIYNEGD